MFDKLLAELFRRSPIMIMIIGILVFLIGATGGLKIYAFEWIIKDNWGRLAVFLFGIVLTGLGIGWLYYGSPNSGQSDSSSNAYETRQTPSEREFQGHQRNYRDNEQLIQQAVGMLSDLWGPTRVDAIRDIYRGLPTLSAEDVAELLGDLWGPTRVDAIEILSPKIQRPISSRGAEIILGDLWGPTRQDAIKALGLRR